MWPHNNGFIREISETVNKKNVTDEPLPESLEY